MAGKRNDDAAVKRGRKVFNVTREEKKRKWREKDNEGFEFTMAGKRNHEFAVKRRRKVLGCTRKQKIMGKEENGYRYNERG